MSQLTAITHHPQDTLGVFSEVLRALGIKPRIIVASEATGAEWEEFAKSDVALILGGAMSVYDSSEYPFIAKEIEILESRLQEDRPTLGVCFGAQLLAATRGARIYRAPRPEFGWYCVHPLPSAFLDPLFARLIARFQWDREPVFHWHQDAYDPPEGAQTLFNSERAEAQVTAYSPRIYGIQFHIELDPEELPDWIAAEPDLEYGRADGVQSRSDIIALGKKSGAAFARFGQDFFKEFLTDAGLWKRGTNE